MSAFIVSKVHIDVMVQAAIVLRVPYGCDTDFVEFRHADELGQSLTEANYQSVDYRYQEMNETPVYKFEGVESELDWAAVAKACSCYQYQSCETPSWDGSVLAGFVLHLRDAAAAKCGMPYVKLSDWMSHGANRRPWEIVDINEALASTYKAS